MIHIEEGQGEYVVIRCESRLDLHASQELSLALLEAKHLSGHILLDFSNVDYLGSSALRALLLAKKEIEEMSGRLSLFSAKDGAKEIIQRAGFSRHLPLYPSECLAIAGLL